MNVQRSFKLMAIGCLVLGLSACGFHLREAATLPVQLQALSVQGVEAYSVLDLSLKQGFYQAGYPLTTKANASAFLVIEKNTTKQRVLSINSVGVANEYELKYHLQFRLVDTENKTLLPQQTITAYRSYRYNPDIVLAKKSEEQRLRKAMTEYAVQQVIRRISKVKFLAE